MAKRTASPASSSIASRMIQAALRSSRQRCEWIESGLHCQPDLGFFSVRWISRDGNRTSQTPSGLASGRVGSQTMASWTGNRFSGWTYDDNGNVTYDGTNHFYYDAENRLIQIDSTDYQYAYDYAGRRILRKTGSVTTAYLYGLTGLLSEFSTTSGVTAAASDDRLEYRVGEQTGTAVMLMDSSGTPRENNRVLPFGEPWVSFAGSRNAEEFTTYHHDNDDGTDLDYAIARYYASRLGRFMMPDPGHVGANVGDPQSWNGYVYSFNDPINFVDPTGLCPPDDENYKDCPYGGQITVGVIGDMPRCGFWCRVFGGGEVGPGIPIDLGPCFDVEFARDCVPPGVAVAGPFIQPQPQERPGTTAPPPPLPPPVRGEDLASCIENNRFDNALRALAEAYEAPWLNHVADATLTSSVAEMKFNITSTAVTAQLGGNLIASLAVPLTHSGPVHMTSWQHSVGSLLGRATGSLTPGRIGKAVGRVASKAAAGIVLFEGGYNGIVMAKCALQQ